MPSRRAATAKRPRLTLGALHRSLLDQFDLDAGLRVHVRFEERATATREGSSPLGLPEVTEERTFEAKLDVVSGQTVRAELRATGPEGTLPVVIRVVESGGRPLYAIGDSGFGELGSRPELFDLERFERRLDEVSVRDAVIDRDGQSGGNVVVDSDIDTEDFESLLRAFAENPGGDGLEIRSYSVSLSAAADVALDYWWSLTGIEPRGDGAALRHAVACHVLVSITGLDRGDADVAPPPPDAGMPHLDHLDAVWAAARERTTGAR